MNFRDQPAGHPLLILRVVRSHTFYWRPRVRSNPLYKVSAHWLWFFFGVERIPNIDYRS